MDGLGGKHIARDASKAWRRNSICVGVSRIMNHTRELLAGQLDQITRCLKRNYFGRPHEFRASLHEFDAGLEKIF